MKLLKRIATLFVMGAIASLMATTAFAAGNPYKDVTVKTVGKDAVKAVNYVKAHHGLDGVADGKFLYPYKKIPRIQFLLMLVNFYGLKNAPISETDLRKALKPVTEDWAVTRMVKVADKLGMNIKWRAPKTKLTYGSASQYLKVFADFSKLFRPRK